MEKGSFHAWVVKQGETGRLEGILNPRERSTSIKPSDRGRSMSVFGRRGVSRAPMDGESVSAVDEGKRFTLVDSGDAIRECRDQCFKLGSEALLENFNRFVKILESEGITGFPRRSLKKVMSQGSTFEYKLNDEYRAFFIINGDGTYTILGTIEHL
jgi:hypothetical protein